MLRQPCRAKCAHAPWPRQSIQSVTAKALVWRMSRTRLRQVQRRMVGWLRRVHAGQRGGDPLQRIACHTSSMAEGAAPAAGAVICCLMLQAGNEKLTSGTFLSLL